MSDSQSREPRKWKLHFSYGNCRVEAANDQFVMNQETIHVIEYSAYRTLEEKLAEAEKNMNFMRGGQWNEVPLLKMKITALKAELDTAQTDYADEMTITSQLHDKVAVLVKERNALKEKLALAVECLSSLKNNIGFGGRDNMLAAIHKIDETLAKLEGKSE